MSAVRLCALDDLGAGEARRFDLDGHRLSVVRIGGDAYVIGDRCSHENISLSEGEVYPDELTIECYKHGSTFSLLDGHPTCLPATKPVPVYEARVVDGDVEVVLG